MATSWTSEKSRPSIFVRRHQRLLPGRVRQCGDRQGLQREEKAQQWDELERSVLSCLSDDIQVGLRSSEFSIAIMKKAE
ncbi:hypothetical protein [Pseudoflavonifractor sp. MSJ-37]|uniref:hypothetical protein n=1 Tax=Pseudoflavonifractor sp. MSJ-37 TaxID=2841531 RepID=UPI001C11B89E|nr:hypothetical protein [Pseudoflavonifractor sp. MSJ-37]MBU5434059.1 hypothetical protein [Pseudoflavonifractor sp. MSJ-37]